MTTNNTKKRQCDLCPTCDETVGFVDDTRLLKVCNHCDVDGDNFNLKEWPTECQIEYHAYWVNGDDLTDDDDEWREHHEALEALIDRRKEELRLEIHDLKQSMEHGGFGSRDIRLLDALENELNKLDG